MVILTCGTRQKGVPNIVCPTAENTQPITKQINVTDLTPKQQRELFCEYISQAGFTGFAKKKNGKQTYYTFTYEK